MKSRAYLVIACTGMTWSSLTAASIADDLQLKIKGYAQARATVAAAATTVDGTDADYYSNIVPGSTTPPSLTSVPGDESEVVRFGLRRVRLTFEATNSTGWFSNVTVRAEPIELSGGNNNSAGVAIYQAFIGKIFKASSLEHTLKFGLDKSFNNDSTISSTGILMGVERPISTLISFQREPGIAYKLTAPALRVGVDLQNGTNVNRSAGTAASANYDARPSPYTSFRIEVSPGADMMPKKKSESYLGVPGNELLLGGDWQNTGRSYAVADQQRMLSVYGPDLLWHLNGLTMLAEFRWTKLNAESTATAAADENINGRHWGAQAGYAIVTGGGLIIEPGLRYSLMNFDDGEDERSSWGLNSSRDNAVGNLANALSNTTLSNATLASGANNLGSGTQLDVGVNLYWNGFANKTQIGYQRWSSEAGEASASAFYVQHQVLF